MGPYRFLLVAVILLVVVQGGWGSSKKKKKSPSPTPIRRTPSPSPRASTSRSCVGPYPGVRNVATSVTGSSAAWRNPDKDYICKGGLSGSKVTNARCTSDVGEPGDPLVSDSGVYIVWLDTKDNKVCWMRSSSLVAGSTRGKLCTSPYTSIGNLALSRDGSSIFFSHSNGNKVCVGMISAMRDKTTSGIGCYADTYTNVKDPALSRDGIKVAWSTSTEMCVGLRAGSKFSDGSVKCVRYTSQESPQQTDLSESGEIVSWSERNGLKVCWMYIDALQTDSTNYRCVDSTSSASQLSLSANGLRVGWSEVGGRTCIANLQLVGFGKRTNSTNTSSTSPSPMDTTANEEWVETPKRCWADSAEEVKFSKDATSFAYTSGDRLCVRDVGEDEANPVCSGSTGSTPHIGPFIRPGAFWAIFVSSRGEICTNVAGSESAAGVVVGVCWFTTLLCALISLALTL